VEAVEDFLFVEGAVRVSQQYLSPFGPQPADNIGVTNNRYTTAGFRVSPYIRGVFSGGATYLLRYDAIWSSLGYTQSLPGATSSYTQRWTGRIDSPIRTFGWSLDASATSTKFTDEQAVTNEIVRGYLNYRPDPQLLLYGIGGYEEQHYVTESSNVVTAPAASGGRPSAPTSGATGRALLRSRPPVTYQPVLASMSTRPATSPLIRSSSSPRPPEETSQRWSTPRSRPAFPTRCSARKRSSASSLRAGCRRPCRAR
jgi:hypothetical protein